MKATWCGDSAQTMQALVVTSCGTRDQSRVAEVWRREPALHISIAKRAGAGALRDVTCLEATIGFSYDIKSPDFCYVGTCTAPYFCTGVSGFRCPIRFDICIARILRSARCDPIIAAALHHPSIPLFSIFSCG